MKNEDFLWGCASAATQIEGASFEDGKGLSIWDMHGKNGKIFSNQTPEHACDSYHRYKEDIALLKELGVKVYRFSISWTRIIPNGYDNKINPKGIEFYNDIINECLKQNIIPFITIYHWDLPYEIVKKGGWLNREISDWFAFYTKVVADAFADRVSHFITINEPQCVIGGLGGTDPDKKYTVKETLTMIHNLLLSHGKACKVLRQYKGVKIGTAFACDGYVPLTESKKDVDAAYQCFFTPTKGSPWGSAIFSDPMLLGKYSKEYFEIHSNEELPDILPGDMEIIHQPLDFLGFNNYCSWPVEYDENETYKFKKKDWGPNMVYTRGGMWPVSPEGIYWITKFYEKRYHMPIIITENGTPTYELISEDGCIHDNFRIEFLKRYILAVKKSKDEGTDIRGYFVWSLIDNLEWYSGFMERFGLVHVNFETFERTKKDSYYWYKDFILKHKNL